VEILEGGVERTPDGYEVDFSVRLAGTVADLRDVVTDYARFAELSPTVESSRIIRGGQQAGGRAARVELKLRPCVFVVFCRTVVKVSDASIDSSGQRLSFVAVPALSDFHEARETVTFRDDSSGGRRLVRFSYSAVLKPKFFVPPIIGPWLVRHRIIKDLVTTSERVERILAEKAGKREP
jgi:hypothetical protein